MKIFFSFLPSQHSFCSKFPKIIYTIFLHLDQMDYSKKGVDRQFSRNRICIHWVTCKPPGVGALSTLHSIYHYPYTSSSMVLLGSKMKPVSRAEPSQASQPINNRGPRQLHELSSVPRVHTFRGNCVKRGNSAGSKLKAAPIVRTREMIRERESRLPGRVTGAARIFPFLLRELLVAKEKSKLEIS